MPALNFQFSFFNFQSNLNLLKFKFKNSLKISNFKFQISLLVFASLFLLISIKTVSAQGINPYTVPNTSPDVPRNQHVWTQTVMIDVMSAMICQIAGFDPTNPTGQCLGVNPQTGQIGYVQGGGGAIGIVGGMIAATYTPPIHTGDYFNYLAQNFGVTKKAYAQGVGFTSIKPLINLWIVFRNMAYLLMVVIFIIVGLAIMLRVKIDPRTVMSIENQIPKIIIGILLVTFSFAIAGFLIDTMYVLIYLIFNLFAQPDAIKTLSSTEAQKSFASFLVNRQQNLGGETVFGFFGLGHFLDIVTYTAGSVKDIVNAILMPKTQLTFDIFNPGSWLQSFSDAIGQATAGFFGLIAGSLALLIVGIAVLYSLFRLWFSLIMAYVFILMDIILAPLWILIGIFPGSSIGFGAWMRDLSANLLVFPTVIAFFIFSKLMMDAFQGKGVVFVPPLIGNPNLSIEGSSFGVLIGLGAILISPQLVDMLKSALKAPKIDLSAVGKAIGVGAGVPGRVAGGGLNAAFGPGVDQKTGMLKYPAGPLARFMRAFGFTK